MWKVKGIILVVRSFRSRFVAYLLVEIGAILKEINNPNKFNCNKFAVLIYLTSFLLWSFFAGVFVFLGKNWLKMLFPPFYQTRSRSLLNCSSVHTEKSIFLQRFQFRIESVPAPRQLVWTAPKSSFLWGSGFCRFCY